MLGVRINFSRRLPSAARLPGGRNRPPYNTRQRQAKPGTLPLRPTFLSRHPFAGDCRAGVHARRESFRTPQPSGSMPALSRRSSNWRGVSGPMLGIVPQSCRSPQCLGCASIFPAAFRLPPCCPAGEIARPTIQGKRQAKPGTECSRQRPFFRHPFVENCRRAFTPAAVTSGCPAFPVQCPLCPAKFPAIAAFPGRCLASSRRTAGHRNALGAHQFFPLPSVCRQAPRRAKSPALQYKANGRRNRERNARGSVHFPGSHLRGIVGRAFTPAAVTSGCPGLPGPMPALPCKVSRNRGVSGPMKIIGPYANGAAIRKASGWCYTARRPIFEHAKHADHQNFSFLIPHS